MITVNYNLFERSLFGVLSHHLMRAGLSYKECQFLVGTMNNKERLETLRFIFNEREQDVGMREQIEHLIAYFNRCTQNRNILAHALLETKLEKKGDGGWYPVDEDGMLEFWKSSKDDWSKINQYRLTLTDLRAVADATHTGYLYAMRLALLLMARDKTAGSVSSLLQATLPEKPQLPDNLTIHRPPEGPNGG